MLEWLVLPALILIVVLAVATAKPKQGGQGTKDDEPEN
jgi:hypothetical protein